MLSDEGTRTDQAAETPEAAIVIVGAARMVPLIEKLAAAYAVNHPECKFDVRGGGSAEGVKKLVAGEAGLAMTSRPLTADEVQAISTVRKESSVAMPVALDAVVFFVAPSNHVPFFSLEQVGRIVSPGPPPWPEFGGTGDRPRLFTQGKASGSVDVVQSRILGRRAFTRNQTELTSMEQLLQAVEQERDAVGFAGLAASRSPHVRVVPLRADENSLAVLPTAATIQSRAYPLAHYLYLCTAGQPSGAIREFLRFIISPEGQVVVREINTIVPLPFSD